MNLISLNNLKTNQTSNIWKQKISGRLFLVKNILIKNDEIKIFSFIGLCTQTKKARKVIVLKNTIKKERIKFIFNLDSPLIIEAIPLKWYKKRSRISKLFYK